MPGDIPCPALGMESNIVQAYTLPPGSIVFFSQTVFKKPAKEWRSSSRMWPTKRGLRESFVQCVLGVVE
jgi:hypothetical protein